MSQKQGTLENVFEETAADKNDIRWYRAPIDRQVLVQLSERRDLAGLMQVARHLGLLGITGAAFTWCCLSGSAVLACVTLVAHGTIYSFLGWAGAGHELAHRTVFRSRPLNVFFLRLFSFLTWNNYVYFVASHTKHHKFTLHPELDGEVQVPQIVRYREWLWALTCDIPALYRAIKITVENSCGVIKGSWGATLFPKSDPAERERVFVCARVILLGHATIVVASLASGLWPLVFATTLAPFFGTWLSKVLALAQHIGMEPAASDFRRNSRTVLPGRFIAFLYWQMNYHLEHHMYPGVPFFNLSKLRAQIQADLPLAPTGMPAIIVEMVSEKPQPVVSAA